MEAGSKHILVAVIAVILLALVGAWWYSGFSFDFMRFFASENVIEEITQNDLVNQPATPAPPAGAVGCLPKTQTIAKDVEALLTAAGGSGSYTWTAPDGSPSSGAGESFKVAFATAGTKKVLVGGPREVVASNSNRSPHDIVACTVVVTP
jgi:hypothetical protein